ncbi:MAG: acyltransferase domain-containing protein, partial [Acidobacteria bacterium]
MQDTAHRAIAIVGVGALLPDARDAASFWENVKSGRYSISEVPTERWDPELYWDPDPKAPDKTYSKIGGWVLDWEWAPLEWRLPIPPRVSDAMDRTQKWAVIGCREALADFGYPERPLDPQRTAVILGNAMAGDLHYLTAMRISFPEYERELAASPSFADLPAELRQTITAEFAQRMRDLLPGITEDSMPGELANIIAGRVASLFDFHGPNYVVDAACASAKAALNAAVEGLVQEDYDAVLTGGIDANMSAATFTKFCKIGALSATGTRPYADGADGFVMGEGAALFLLKRLPDAERDGDPIYAVIRGLGGSSDGKGKGITAPNPVGQKLAVERAWKNAGVSPSPGTLIEGHGTSTKVGDVAEVESLIAGLSGYGLDRSSIPLGSVKSNIGHLKGAAGAAGLLKATLALSDKLLPPSLNFERPNPNIDFANCPFYVNTELQPWEVDRGDVRRVGVSAFGFGGTNFHTVLEEYVPGRIRTNGRKQVAIGTSTSPTAADPKAPMRGALLVGAGDNEELVGRLRRILEEAEEGRAPAPAAPDAADLGAAVRLAIDYDTAPELAKKAAKAIKAITTGRPGMWKPLNAQGVFVGRGAASKVAFLYTGQGSQYLEMLRQLREVEPIIADTFAEADAVMTPLLGKPLTDYLFIGDQEGERLVRAEEELRQTAITQPAVLTTDIALTRLLAAYGVTPDFVMGHSLGEYGALVAAGALPFGEALEAVSARGREMTRITEGDNGAMAAVIGPLADVERIVEETEGYVVVANYNSPRQSVIGGATEAVDRAMAACKAAGHQAQRLQVSHAFHTKIVAPAREPLEVVLRGLHLESPKIPIVGNVDGGLYPMGPDVVPEMIDILTRQVSSPVQFVKGLETLYEAGARVFVEVGPKKALHGMVRDVLREHDEVLALFTNNQKTGEIVSFNQALCGLYAAGFGTAALPEREEEAVVLGVPEPEPRPVAAPQAPPVATHQPTASKAGTPRRLGGEEYRELGQLFADFLEKGFEVYSRGSDTPQMRQPVVITGAALGLPGTERIFDDGNIERLLRGDQFITPVPDRFRQAMVDKNIVRLVKSERGEPRFETIGSTEDVIRLAARGGRLDLVEEFGYPADRLPALDVVTELAIGSGLDALRDAGIPLVMRYKTTTKGTQLPERWGLPDELRDDTGVIFGSAFPGADFLAAESGRYHTDLARRQRLEELEELRQTLSTVGSSEEVLGEVEKRIAAVRQEIEADPYTFERRFLFKLLSMGHSQFAEFIGARGPNTQINAACATATQAVGLAEDWIRSGRCRRVVIISSDDVTSDHLLEWIGAGFLASGAAATDERVEEAAIPFDRRRHGMLIGMGAAAIVVESLEAAQERGIQPICEVLAAVTANSAFHGTRLDVDHITQVMEDLMRQAEERWGIDRLEIAPQTVFISHETYTPARGGSAQAEVYALRDVFGPAADQVVIANTKGYTGHPMAVGIEDVLAIKTLETGLVPPVANFREVDPDLGNLNLSAGGAYPVRYALRLGAGFGSQISLSLIRWVPTADGQHRAPRDLGYAYRIVDPAAWQGWLGRVSGHQGAEVEIVKRTLRVKDQGPPSREARTISAEPARPATPVPVPEAATAVAAVSEPAVPTATKAPDPVQKRVLEIVSETTGYPPDMLDLDLDMEADLGIDTVKQAETFAAIREEWGIPRDDDLQLRDFPTLAHAIQFVYDRRPDLKAAAAADGSEPEVAVVDTG